MAANTTQASDPAFVSVVRELFENTLHPIADIAARVGLSDATTRLIIKQNYSGNVRKMRSSACYKNSKVGAKNPMHGKCGDAHHNYKGVVQDGRGYLMQLKPEWYTGRRGSKHVFVHTVVLCAALGLSELPSSFVVHHIDGDRTNNDIDNLALVTVSGHGRIHSMERATTSRKGVGSRGPKRKASVATGADDDMVCSTQ